MLNQTNSANADTFRSLQRGVDNCTEMWNRPPNFLPADYCNIGDFNSSVFKVASTANNVGYDRADCWGTSGASGVLDLFELTRVLLGVIVLFAALA